MGRFYHDNVSVLFEQIKNGDFDFPDPYWTDISPAAKDICRRLMTVDIKKRITIPEALRHPWLQSASPAPIQGGRVEMLKRFNARRKFRAVARLVTSAQRIKNIFKSSKK